MRSPKVGPRERAPRGDGKGASGTRRGGSGRTAGGPQTPAGEYVRASLTIAATPSCRAGAVLVGLYEEPERPHNAVDYIKRYMGAPTGVDVEAIRTENEELKGLVENLTNTNNELQERIKKMEGDA